MNTQYLEMPETLLAELGENVELTKEMNYAHPVGDSMGNTLFNCTMYRGKRYKTDKEMIDKAAILYKENKDKAISNVGNKLVFVGMGCNYTKRYDDDVCNHRIRTELINKDGKRYFVELGTCGNEKMRADHVVDRDLEDIYSNKLIEIRNEIEKNGGFLRISHNDPLMISYKKYQNQPYYWFEKEKVESLINKGIKYTNENVLKFVNDIFGCKFTEMEVDYYHLNTSDFTCVSPK